jgi:hypothetical protein
MTYGALNGPFVGFQKPAEFIIMPIDDSGAENEDYGGAKVLQYWPESIQTSRTSNWSGKSIPGLPVPLRQWTGGGEHTISFTVVFSTDMDGEVEEDKFNVNVEAAIAWLNMLTLPTYQAVGDSEVAHAPPVVWLFAPNNYLGNNTQARGDLASRAEFTGETVSLQSSSPFSGGTLLNNRGSGIYVTVNSVDTTRMNWFQSGKTRFASIAISCSETIQIAGKIYPYSAVDFAALANLYKRKP